MNLVYYLTVGSGGVESLAISPNLAACISAALA